MRKLRDSLVSALVGGVLIVVPIYLTILLLLKAMQTVGGVVRPLAELLPAWLPAERLLSFLLVLLVCTLIGAVARTRVGRAVRERCEKSCLERLPGYALVRSMTEQLAGHREEKAWKPALAEIEEALVPAFIIEELDDGSSTVFVPSVPTPLAGTVYILTPDRVHPVDVPFAKAIMAVSRWGLGSKDLVAAMAPPGLAAAPGPHHRATRGGAQGGPQ
ncbi:MAG TPA: DUF6338 family protein [Gemmatimonadales bacterium]|nr:DUF6338 family protein [Gemmatimonadales bacterium]